MRLDAAVAAFGRHESFPLRYGWITKGLRALDEDSRIFTQDDATVRLGVGKNMVSAIRHWLLATRIVEKDDRQGLVVSPVGRIVFPDDDDGGDPYLEDEATIWLLHWLMATNPSGATAIYWFFNHFHKTEFGSGEVAATLSDFVRTNVKTRVAASTLKNDATLVLRMYAPAREGRNIAVEDMLNSPLAVLHLLDRIDTRTWRAFPTVRDELPLDVFAFAVAELFDHVGTKQLSVTQLMYSEKEHCAPGAVFRMTEEGLVQKVEALCAAFPDSLRMDRTAGIYQLYRTGDIDAGSILRRRYAADAARVHGLARANASAHAHANGAAT